MRVAGGRKNKSWCLYGLVFFLVACKATQPNFTLDKKYAPDELRYDCKIVWDTYRECHPSLSWRTPADTVNYYFNFLYESLTDSLTEAQFKNRLAFVVAKIKCGHTSVRHSEAYSRASAKYRGPSFPLAVKVWGTDSMVVLGNSFRFDTVMVRGTIIKSINGVPAATIISEMQKVISTDGDAHNLQWRVISSNFGYYYKHLFGLQDNYLFEIVDGEGNMKRALLKNYAPVMDTMRRRTAALPPPSKPTKKQLRQRNIANKRSFTIDSSGVYAYMQLNTFTRARLSSFFRKSFRTLHEKKIPNLVIDLRENGGGTITKSTRLTQYITDHPFKVADTAFAVNFKYPYPQYIKSGFWYKMQHLLVSRRRSSDGFYHLRYYEKTVYNPRKRSHYNGHVYIITGGLTFSASTLFINPLLGQQNVTLIGEETGGGAHGNSAINIPEMTLPLTGIKVRLPLYRLVLPNTSASYTGGIPPAIAIPPDSRSLRSNTDPKMAYIRRLLLHK